MCPRRRWGREGEGVVAYASHVIFHRLRPSLKSVWGTNRAHLIPSFFVCPRESLVQTDVGRRWGDQMELSCTCWSRGNSDISPHTAADGQGHQTDQTKQK